MGGGNVAQRRVPTLIAAGADVHLVSPEVTPAIEGLVGSGEVQLASSAASRTHDLDGAWYVMAATDDPAVNARVSELAEQQRIFCVRADDADAATAFTPAVGRHAGDTVAVMGSSAADRDPRRHAGLRDEIVTALREGSLAAKHHRDRGPGVVLVGGGPGDPELISVAGRKALMEADVVVADRLAPRELLASCPPTPRSSTSPSCRAAARRSRSRSTRSSSRPRSPGSGWPGSRAATTSSSAVATRR